MKIYKGIIHVHSNYSYDGEHSLKEIVQYAKNRSYSFIGMSEHSDTLDKDKMSKYVEECKAVSTADCLIIPGVEFTCENNIHIIGIGVQQITYTKEPLEIAEFINQQNGISIIAHPSRYNYQIPTDLNYAVTGIEVWNAAYDGRFVPNYYSLNLVKKIRKRKDSILAFGGQELHRIQNHFNVETTIYCNKLSKDTMLQALKKGDFTISNPYFQLDPINEIKWLKLLQIYIIRKIYYIAKQIKRFDIQTNKIFFTWI
jgi:hypothetical protein